MASIRDKQMNRRRDREQNRLFSSRPQKTILSRAQKIRNREQNRLQDIKIKKELRITQMIQRNARARKRQLREAGKENKITKIPSMEIQFAPREEFIPRQLSEEEILINRAKQDISGLRESSISLKKSAVKSFAFIRQKALSVIKTDSTIINNNIRLIDTNKNKTIIAIKDLVQLQQNKGEKFFLCKNVFPSSFIETTISPGINIIAVLFSNRILGVLTYTNLEVIKIPLLCANKVELLKGISIGRLLIKVLEQKIPNKTLQVDSVKSAVKFYTSIGFTSNKLQSKKDLISMTKTK